MEETATVAGLLVRNNRVLLWLRAAWKQVFPLHWDAIAGRVEPGEAVESALSRELSEEIGVTTTAYHLLETFDRQLPDRMHRHHVFAVTGWLGEPANISDENAQIGWFTPAEMAALPKLTPDLLSVVAKAVDPGAGGWPLSDSASESFCDALRRDDLAAIRACPKADLHNHAVLGGDRAFLEAWSGRRIPALDRPLASMDQMHEWVGRKIGPLFDTLKGRLKAIEAAFVLARIDGVTRLETGDDVWAITQFGSAAAQMEAFAALHRTVAPDIEWIPQLGLSRHCAVDAIERWLTPFLELGGARTIDLAGDEFAQPIGVFAPLYRQARAAGLRLKAHVGEWGTADDVWRAVETLELDEVQHGIAAASSPDVMRFLADHRIRLNICPTSNVMLGRVESLTEHPIRRLHEAGVIVTVNTDDALVFGRTVSEEFLALCRAGTLGAEALNAIRRNGLSERARPATRWPGQARP